MTEIIEQATNEHGDTYQLLRAGWGFKSVVVRDGVTTKKRHRFASQARGDKNREGFEL